MIIQLLFALIHPIKFFVLGTQAITGFGVSQVLDSRHPDFRAGDYVWGSQIGWEQYSLITAPENLLKIKHTDVPLSYYTGLLGKMYRTLQICCVFFFSSIHVAKRNGTKKRFARTDAYRFENWSGAFLCFITKSSMKH